MPDETRNPEDQEEATPYAVEGNDTSGYVGVSSDYMTYANDTEKPLVGDEADLLDELEDAKSTAAVDLSVKSDSK